MHPTILSLAKQLIRIPSPPGDRLALDRLLELALSHLRDFTIERFETNGVKSALVYNTKKRPRKFKIILNGHLDVIPGKPHQYIPRRRGRRLYGVGAMDMKANVACLILTFKEVAASVDYPLALQLVTDEETGGFCGTKYQIERGVRADFVIAGETTNFHIANRAKGVLCLEVNCKGKTAHGAYPWKGKNAIETMLAFLLKVHEKFPTPKKEIRGTTVNLSSISTGNRSFNKIPDACMASLDVRYPPENENAIARIFRAMAPRGCSVRVIAQEPALCTHEDNPFIRSLRAIAKRHTSQKIVLYGAHGTSDARHFMRVGCPGIEFGPVGGGIGTDNEWIDVPSLERYCRILHEWLLSLDDASMREKN